MLWNKKRIIKVNEPRFVWVPHSSRGFRCCWSCFFIKWNRDPWSFICFRCSGLKELVRKKITPWMDCEPWCFSRNCPCVWFLWRVRRCPGCTSVFHSYLSHGHCISAASGNTEDFWEVGQSQLSYLLSTQVFSFIVEHSVSLFLRL